MSLIELLRRTSRPSRIAAALLVLAFAAVAGDGIAPTGGETGGTGGKVKIENTTKKKQRLTRIVLVKKGTDEPQEIIEVDVIIEPGKSYEVQSSQFEKPELKDSTMTPTTLAPAWSRQSFTLDTHPLTSKRWTLLYAGGTSISYGFTAADLLGSVPVPPDQSIFVLNGSDRSGHFPSTVVFMDDVMQTPYTGTLVSAGEIASHDTWSLGLFDGSSGLTGSTPLLDGSGDFTANGTLQLRLSHAQPGALAVLVAGLTEINLPFAGTVLGPEPRIVVPGLIVDEQGQNLLAFTLGDVPPGLDVCVQEFVLDGTSSPAATNTLHAISW
jgi:hypothetical protein